MQLECGMLSFSVIVIHKSFLSKYVLKLLLVDDIMCILILRFFDCNTFKYLVPQINSRNIIHAFYQNEQDMIKVYVYISSYPFLSIGLSEMVS